MLAFQSQAGQDRQEIALRNEKNHAEVVEPSVRHRIRNHWLGKFAFVFTNQNFFKMHYNISVL